MEKALRNSKGNRMVNLKFVALVLFTAVFGFASVNVQADPGDIINPEQIAFIDKESGNTYHIYIEAKEYVENAGVGSVSFQLNGPKLSLTTVGQGWNGEPPQPYLPLATIIAGRASSQAVNIGAHVVEISAHAFVHSDAPFKIVFIGPVTVDVRVERKAGNIHVVISTPKGEIKLEGKLIPGSDS